MRRLQKASKPQVLIDNAGDWTAELLAILARGEKPSDTVKGRYRHAQIKDALKSETSHKCAYCESKVTHVTYGDIEHIIPKSKVPAKAYEWDNLTLACDVCNTNKGDEYSDDPANSQDNLIDPYADTPTDHFIFSREIITPRPDSPRGYITDDIIKLSRNELVERRRERMEFIDGLIMAWSNAQPALKDVLLKNLYEKHLQPSDEYVASSLAYIAHLRSAGVLP